MLYFIGIYTHKNCPFKYEAAATPAAKADTKAKPKADIKSKVASNLSIKKMPKSKVKSIIPAIRLCRA